MISSPVDIVPPTRIGAGPFDLDEQGRFRCPRKHVPQEQLLISPRLYRLLRELKVRRFDVEVAHWG